MANGELTDKEAAFVREYLKDFNGTQAAIRAKYAAKNARFTARDNLTKPHIQQALIKQIQAIVKEDVADVDRVVSELVTVAFANMADYATWSDDGVSIVPSDQLTRSQTAAVQEVSEESVTYVDKDGELQTRRKVKFRLHSKVAALGKLEKYIEMGQMGMVPWRDVLDALAEMARAVEMYVSDPDTLDNIKAAWSRIPIRPQTVVNNGTR